MGRKEVKKRGRFLLFISTLRSLDLLVLFFLSQAEMFFPIVVFLVGSLKKGWRCSIGEISVVPLESKFRHIQFQ